MKKELLSQVYQHPLISSDELQKIIDSHQKITFKKGEFILKRGRICQFLPHFRKRTDSFFCLWLQRKRHYNRFLLQLWIGYWGAFTVSTDSCQREYSGFEWLHLLENRFGYFSGTVSFYRRISRMGTFVDDRSLIPFQTAFGRNGYGFG